MSTSTETRGEFFAHDYHKIKRVKLSLTELGVITSLTIKNCEEFEKLR